MFKVKSILLAALLTIIFSFQANAGGLNCFYHAKYFDDTGQGKLLRHVQDAYDDLALLGLNDITVLVAGSDILESLFIDRNIRVTFSGDYNCKFSDRTSITSIFGNLRISDGTVIVDGVNFVP